MRSKLFVKASIALVLILVASHAVRAADPPPSERDEISSTTKGVEEGEDAADMHRYRSSPEGCTDYGDDCLFSGDVNGNGIPGELVDLAYLALFVDGAVPWPDPWYEANANGDCHICWLDVEYFECILLPGPDCTGEEYYPHPAPCQCWADCCLNRMGSVILDNESSNYCYNHDDHIVDIADLTNLIDHLFVSFASICCPDEADFAPLMYGEPQDGAIDVADLTGLIDHLFINFTELPCCY